MRGRILLLTIGVLAVLVSLSGCGGERGEEVVARVGKADITKSELDKKLASLQPFTRQQYSGLEGAREFLDKLIEEEVLYQAAQASGYGESPEVKDAVEAVTKRAMIRAYYRDEIESKIVVPEEEIQEYYDEYEDRFQRRARLSFRHVMTKTRSEATSARSRVLAGESFADVAREVSVDRNSSEAGGLMKYVYAGDALPQVGMDQEFIEMLFEWKPGEISEALRSNSGWHLVRLEDKQDAGTKPLDEVRDSIVTTLTPVITKQVLEDKLQELRDRFNAEVNEDYFTVKARSAEDLFALAQETDDPVKRLGYYAELVMAYPDGEYAAEAQFMIGFIHSEELQNYDAAKNAFNRMLEKYPDSELAESARWMLDNMGSETPPFEEPSGLRTE